MEKTPDIRSADYWFKIVEFLKQNWAVIEKGGNGYTVYFFDDRARIFDKLDFGSIPDAENALKRNGFDRYEKDKDAQELIAKPERPFELMDHTNGAIYSSGRFWH